MPLFYLELQLAEQVVHTMKVERYSKLEKIVATEGGLP